MSTPRDAAGTEAVVPVLPPVSPALDFAAGTVAGIASLFTGHPFDTVKVRLQTQPRPARAVQANAATEKPAELYYRNAGHAFARVVREEGMAGLYKGVLGVALMNASVFTSYKLAMNAMLSSPDTEPTLTQITAAGAASGVFTSVITTPIERLKILQQASSVGARSAQPSVVALVRSHSLRSLYRGWSATLLRDFGYGPYFLVYEYVARGGNFGLFSSGAAGEEGKRRRVKADLVDEVENEVHGSDGQAGAGAVRVLVAGGLAGIAGWGFTFPIDVVKTKIQAETLPSSPSPTIPASTASIGTLPARPRATDATLRSAFLATYREGGWRAFVAGLGPTLVRSVPVNMVTFAVFELVVSTFR
ncbi:uncharacterized protein JCM10292_006945 [Rhodotorula paludigena]|uniref:uncharacterized protein n=1 Tax=Rhodotorula paludigena TaxID=86838 RepID=UPI0031775EA7